jgi:hypothetical protein
MQAHTILRPSAQKYANKPVLVVGGKRDALRKVAERCGGSPLTYLLPLKTIPYKLRIPARIYNSGRKGLESRVWFP